MGKSMFVISIDEQFIKLLQLWSKFQISTDGDVLCFIDFRADRMRQINEAFGIKPPFETDVIPKDLVSIYKHRDKWYKHQVCDRIELSAIYNSYRTYPIDYTMYM